MLRSCYHSNTGSRTSRLDAVVVDTRSDKRGHSRQLSVSLAALAPTVASMKGNGNFLVFINPCKVDRYYPSIYTTKQQDQQ